MNRERAERLVALRARREEALQSEVAALQARARAAAARLVQLQDQLDRQRSAPASGTVIGIDLARAEAYTEHLREQMRRQQAELRHTERQLAQLRQRLTRATQERMAAEAMLMREDQARALCDEAWEQYEVDENVSRTRLPEER